MRRLLYNLIPVLVLLIEGSAMAAPPPAEPPEPAAQRRMRGQAERLVGGGQLAEARDVHMSLWRVGQRPLDAFNVGTLSQRIGDHPAAAEYLTLWLDLVGSPEAPRGAVPWTEQDRQKHAQARVDLQAARAQVGALQINVSDPGAEVLVDGRRVGLSPLERPVFVWPGQHRVSAQLGGSRLERVVSTKAGDEQTVRLVLPASPAEAQVDGARGLRRVSEAPPSAPPSPRPGAGRRWLTVGGLAATSAALGVFGGVAAGVASGAAEERDAALARVQTDSVSGCPGGAACSQFTDADGRAKTWTTLSVGAFVGAGLSAAGAAAAYLLLPAGPVRVTTGGAGVQLATSW
ncbi:hypothetical protein SOCE26_084300 [Sorangium cellulosum]|uniref:Uncharacterized protein n=1 Tax=Sorangium cellulosum TaxID=56 RepID=A0A2L0F5S8_SORCE|nr:PEGA domain-containing protein [Sorangium cellulosum]AUX46920.1 hypothetical protein SOCE26_084300 [Sorangium cellulosum]